MSFSKQETVLEIEEEIRRKHLLNHPFYQAWNQGKLSKECLKEYAKQYYHHVKAFPTYLSSLHSHTDDPETRKELLKNLIEEEGGSPNHPDLWKEFAKSLGADDVEIQKHLPNAEMQNLILNFKEICREGSVAEGVGALFAYESQIPELSISKIKGLKDHYDMKNPKDWKYFTVHIDADTEHSRVERELLLKHLDQTNSPKTKEAVERVLECLWNFLSSLVHQFQIAC